MTSGLPPEVDDYLARVVAELSALLGPRLLAVWTTGSLALGDYRPGRSDIDLMAVIDDRPVAADLLRRVAAELDHSRVPCPAAGLELVVYPRRVVAGAAAEAGYVLNLNTGPLLPPVVSLDPAGDLAFWYVIDRSMTRQTGWPLFGPSPREIMEPVATDLLRGQVLASLAEHARADGGHLADNAVLNGCRGWRFVRDGVWYAKVAAARRTLAERDLDDDDRALIASAVASFDAGRGPTPVDPERVRRFLLDVVDRIRTNGA